MATFIWLALLFQVLCVSGFEQGFHKHSVPGEFRSTKSDYNNRLNIHKEGDSDYHTRVFLDAREHPTTTSRKPEHSARSNRISSKTPISQKLYNPTYPRPSSPHISEHSHPNNMMLRKKTNLSPSSRIEYTMPHFIGEIPSYISSASPHSSRIEYITPHFTGEIPSYISSASPHSSRIEYITPHFTGEIPSYISAGSPHSEFMSTPPRSSTLYSPKSPNIPKYMSLVPHYLTPSHQRIDGRSHAVSASPSVKVSLRSRTIPNAAEVSTLNFEWEKHKPIVHFSPKIFHPRYSAARKHPVHPLGHSERLISKKQNYEFDKENYFEQPHQSLPIVVYVVNSEELPKHNLINTIEKIPSLLKLKDGLIESSKSLPEHYHTKNILDSVHIEHSDKRKSILPYSELHEHRSIPYSSNLEENEENKIPTSLNQPMETPKTFKSYFTGNGLDYQKSDYTSVQKPSNEYSSINIEPIGGNSLHLKLFPPSYPSEQIASSSIHFPLNSEYKEDSIQGANVYFKPVNMPIPLSNAPPTDHSSGGQPPVPGEEGIKSVSSKVTTKSNTENTESQEIGSDKSLDNSSDNSSNQRSTSARNYLLHNWLDVGYPKPTAFDPFNYDAHTLALLRGIMIRYQLLHRIPPFLRFSPAPLPYNFHNLAVPSLATYFGRRSLVNPALPLSLTGLSIQPNASGESNSTNANITQKTSGEIPGMSTSGFHRLYDHLFLPHEAHIPMPSLPDLVYNDKPVTNFIYPGTETVDASPDKSASNAFTGKSAYIPHPLSYTVSINNGNVPPSYLPLVPSSGLTGTLLDNYPPHVHHPTGLETADASPDKVALNAFIEKISQIPHHLLNTLSIINGYVHPSYLPLVPSSGLTGTFLDNYLRHVHRPSGIETAYKAALNAFIEQFPHTTNPLMNAIPNNNPIVPLNYQQLLPSSGYIGTLLDNYPSILNYPMIQPGVILPLQVYGNIPFSTLNFQG